MAEDLRDLARRVVGRVLAERGAAGGEHRAGVFVRVARADATDRPADAAPGPAASAGSPGKGRPLVTAECLERVPDGGALDVAPDALVTPLAREEAERRGIRLGPGASRAGSGIAEGGRLRVAVGCDHGGYALKLDVVAWVRELGHEALDLGTHDENPVDYPDYARAVAETVAAGRCDLGVCVDGAGIGSAMAANKVPGVRAANAWDTAGARNAREHNYANVLTLGGRSLGRDAAFEVLRTFLSTPEGPERHARRVAKITAIEQAYSRGSAARL